MVEWVEGKNENVCGGWVVWGKRLPWAKSCLSFFFFSFCQVLLMFFFFFFWGVGFGGFETFHCCSCL